MTVKRIHYFFTAPVGLYWNKIGLEAEIIEGEDVRQCLYALKKQVEEFHYESKAAAEKMMGTQVTVVVEEKPNEIDENFEHVKMMLNKHTYREDAQEYLNESGFHLNIDCKNIVNSKPSKDEHK